MPLGERPVAQFDRKLDGGIARQFVGRVDGERAVRPFDPVRGTIRPKEVKGKPRQEIRTPRVELEGLDVRDAGAGTIEYFLARPSEREPDLAVGRVGSEG